MKRIIVWILWSLPLLGLQAQNERTCFVNMPDSLLPLLTPVNRADCVDFLESNMKAEVTNVFDRKSQMTHLSDDYIRLQLTPQSTWQMKLLAVTDSTKVICVVSTVCAPACDSRICFYSTDWHPLPASDYLPSLPGLADFLKPAPVTQEDYRYEDAVRSADMLLMRADLSPADACLTITWTTPDYLGKETADKLRPFIRRESVVYEWRGGRYVTLP